MKPEYLHQWQPQATMEQLNDFIQQNLTLFTLLEESWQKFAAMLPEQTAPVSADEGEPIDWDTLEHFPISDGEMIEFLNHFEKERYHNDRPFGNHVKITEQDWELE